MRFLNGLNKRLTIFCVGTLLMVGASSAARAASHEAQPLPLTQRNDKSAKLMLNIYDESGALAKAGTVLTVELTDDRGADIVQGTFSGPTILFDLHGIDARHGATFTLHVDRAQYRGETIHAVALAPNAVQTVNVVLVPKRPVFDFSAASAEALSTQRPDLWRVLAGNQQSPGEAKTQFDALIRSNPMVAGALLNILEAESELTLPSGRTPLAYYHQVIFDDSMEQDRFFAWVDKSMMDDIRTGASQGMFAAEPKAKVFHPGATDSWKETRFDRANLHFTFHGDEVQTVDGIECVKLEVDIDYYKNKLKHTLVELIPNMVTGNLTDPRVVYEMRRSESMKAGDPPFAAPQSLVPASKAQIKQEKATMHKKRRDLRLVMIWRWRHAW